MAKSESIRDMERRYAAERQQQLARTDLCERCKRVWNPPVEGCVACALVRLRGR